VVAAAAVMGLVRGEGLVFEEDSMKAAVHCRPWSCIQIFNCSFT
jgi:hypothetical protein